LQFRAGKALDSKSFLEKKYGKNINNHLGQTWGKVTVSLNIKAENFVKVFGANHLSATLGNFTRELELFCRQTGIKPLRIDSDEQMEKFYNEIRLSM
jgi:L-fucose isomerase-like protein